MHTFWELLNQWQSLRTWFYGFSIRARANFKNSCTFNCRLLRVRSDHNEISTRTENMKRMKFFGEKWFRAIVSWEMRMKPTAHHWQGIKFVRQQINTSANTEWFSIFPILRLVLAATVRSFTLCVIWFGASKLKNYTFFFFFSLDSFWCISLWLWFAHFGWPFLWHKSFWLIPSWIAIAQ